MSFTYNIVKLATDKVAQVRLATGQTKDTEYTISDEEIKYILSIYNEDVPTAVKHIVQTLLLSASQSFDRSTGEVSESRSQVYSNLKDAVTDGSIGLGGLHTPVNLHFGGLDSEEFDERNKDNSVYHGFRTEDNCPLEKQNCGLEVLGITEYQPGTEESVFEKTISSDDWVQDQENSTYYIEILFSESGLFPVSSQGFNESEQEQTISEVITGSSIVISVPSDPDSRFTGRLAITGLLPSKSKVVLDEC